MTTSMRRTALACALLATTALGAPAFAQYAPPADVPPVHSTTDQFDVDLVTRKLTAQVYGSISIGDGGPGSLTYVWSNSNRSGSDMNAGIDISGSKYSVYVAGATRIFTLSGTLGTGTFANDSATGETLTYDAGTSQYTYTTREGAVAVFGPVGGSGRFPLTLTYPTGEKLTFF